jgi:molecular chaperone DnaK
VAQTASKAVGIDLGTTNSAVAVMNPTDQDLVIHQTGSRGQTTPSAVWRDPRSGELVVGRKAAARISSVPPPVRSVKRLMGTGEQVSFGGGELRTPVEVSAAILGEMKRQIEEDVAAFDTSASRWIVDRAVVTVPAYFDQPQMEATREAAESAGLQVVDLLHEPTAAASFHCWRSGVRDGLFLVYDFGGGTFDVSVVRCHAGDFQVLGIGGNNRLGGDDIDLAVADHLRELLTRDGWDMALDPERDEADRLRFRQLKALAESAKIGLSAGPEYLVHNSVQLTDRSGDHVILDALLDRSTLDAIARPIVERTFDYCAEALELAARQAKVTLSDVDQIILAGGSTKLPMIREMVTSRLCASSGGGATAGRAKCRQPVYDSVDTVVALGAAIRASAIGGLQVYDEHRTVRVSLTGTSVTGRQNALVAGSVEALEPGTDFRGGRAELTAGTHQDETALSGTGAFRFRQVPLQSNAQSLLTLDFFDAQGQLRATAERPAVHDSEAPVTGGSRADVTCNKAILLEVERDGRRTRKELVAAMTSLPVKSHFSLIHPGNTEKVRFSLFQKSRLIKSIVVPVPSSTPQGAPIELDLELDAEQLITIRGTIGSTAFDAMVEVPPERPLPTPEEAASLERQFHEAVQYLSAGDQNVLHARWQRVHDAFEQARKAGGTSQAVHEFEELEEIVAALDERSGGLEPAKDTFDELVAVCLDMNSYAASKTGGGGGEQPHDAREMVKAIEAQREHGERAFRDRDQHAYSEAVRQLEGYRKHLAAIARRIMNDEPGSPALLAAAALRQLHGMLEETGRQLTVAPSAVPEQRRVMDDIARRMSELESQIERDPHGVQQQAVVAMQQLNAVQRALPGGKHPGGDEVPVDK